MNYAIAVAVMGAAYLVYLYRYRGVHLSPDGKFYAAMGQGIEVPSPYARRWLLPMLLRARDVRWNAVSIASFVAVGPLMYALTDSLACVWLIAWLPGLACNVRFPVLVDGCAFALMLLAVVLFREGYVIPAMGVVFVSGQVKETAPAFGAVLCMDPVMAIVGGLSMLAAMGVGAFNAAPPTEEYQRTPFKVALTKHDPLDWRTMLLPWGGVLVIGCAAWAGVEQGALVVALVSLAMGYGQLLLANDEARLFVWAAPAVLIAVAGYEGAWMAPALMVHPWACGAARRV